MKQLSLLMSILAVLGLTACEKTLDVADTKLANFSLTEENCR